MYEIKKDYMNRKEKIFDPTYEWIKIVREYLISNYDTYKENFKKYNSTN